MLELGATPPERLVPAVTDPLGELTSTVPAYLCRVTTSESFGSHTGRTFELIPPWQCVHWKR